MAAGFRRDDRDRYFQRVLKEAHSVKPPGAVSVFGLEDTRAPRRADECRGPDFAELDSCLLIPTR